VIVLAGRLLRATYLRYIAASAVALGADLCLFLVLLRAHVPAMVAAGAGYCLGVGVHWLLSSRTVFAESLAERGLARHRQGIMFACSALAGLGATMAVTGIGAALHLDPRLARLAAVAVAFQLVWLLRRRWVFAP
jgi:putative flippase GtrA